MSKRLTTILVAVFMTIVLSLTAACNVSAKLPTENAMNNAMNNVSSSTAEGVTSTETLETIATTATSENVSATDGEPTGEYNEGVVLVKCEGEMNLGLLSEVAFQSYKPLYPGSKWNAVTLKDATKTVEAVKTLTQSGKFAAVDYDYVMGSDGEVESVEVSCNPDWDKQERHHDAHRIPDGWRYNKDHGKEPGGSNDVIVAVIDTGVDYNHIDLRNNIWINSGEIPGNGIDDDGNGYVDDVYGWNFVGDNNAPLDDNGHGTHVAGIIAAENNQIGGVGVAYNSKVMVLKAGNSSGYFNNSDIAEAIQYAYMNGASVINMSFGGSAISIAVEEALENAYNACVLVAAAGNDGACNNLACLTCINKSVSYPAAFPYVIGVMSTNSDCTATSSFSNYDHYPYNSVEYEVYAVGESVFSTWPNNKFATLNGTSMAAPYVSGIAALLRTAYPDRNTYSTKYLQSQIVNTGSINLDGAHTVANVYEAMTKLPTPEVNLYDYRIDDSTSVNANNNGNGIADAGETIRLYVSLQNRGGVASNVKVTLDTIRNNDPSLTDQYFTIVNDTVNLSDIGTYSVREANETQYFEIKVSSDCPNDYTANFNVKFTYTNGMNANDNTVYEDDGKQQAQFTVSKGYYLPSVIAEDTVFTNDRLYIVGQNAMIPVGVTVTFEEGCEIQFYDDRIYYDSPAIKVYGSLIFEGSKESMIKIYPSERYSDFACIIFDYGTTTFNYVNAVNLFASGVDVISNSYLKHSDVRTYYYNDAEIDSSFDSACGGGGLSVGIFTNNYIEVISYATEIIATTMDSNFIKIASSNTCVVKAATFTNNIVYSLIKGNIKVVDRMSIFDGRVFNNKFLCEDNTNPVSFMGLKFRDKSLVINNYFDAGYRNYADQIISEYYNSKGEITVDLTTTCSDVSALYPHIESVEIFNADGEQITTIGKEEIKVRVTFSKAMDTTKNANVFFGTIEPYADYKIEGAFVSDTVWEGTYELKAYIENGLQKLIVKGACAADDATKTVRGENQLYEFDIDTTAAMSMNLFATATDTGIELTWAQDDYDTLMGYNIYRATSKDGNYVKINPSVLLASESSFVDENAEPGVTYWYTFAVVLSDFSESTPAGKVYCTAVDTLNPTVYHTPVNQGYMNNNLVISCTASDNVGISCVTLYYRTKGETTWKTLVMSKQSDKYSATIFGGELTLDGIEYYIVASDGRNTINKGSAEIPYTVVIKDASAISRKGDVDGDGVVTTKDALMLMQCINGDLILSDDEFKSADLNGDGVLSSFEALRILQYINGNVSTLEMQ